MSAHSLTAESMSSAQLSSTATKQPMYRWRCGCGKVGPWNASARNARAGGAMHQRIAENPRPRKEP